MAKRPRPLPSAAECRSGVPLALANADAHLVAADVLAASGRYGFALAHLVYAVEESEKARTLGKVVIGDTVSEPDLRAAMYAHDPRHMGAMTKSWTSGAIGIIVDTQQAYLWEKLGRRSPQTDDERWRDAVERHPEVLPLDWPEIAGPMRERGLYVDLTENGWTSPDDAAASEFERLRPAVARQLGYVRAAYERQIVASGEQAT